jgi:hypothetical protein
MSESDPTANFCSECGAPIHGGRFCANCGTPSGVHQAVTPALAAAAAERSAADPAEPITNGAPKVTQAAPVTGTVPVVERAQRFDRDTPPPPPPPPPAPGRSGPSRGLVIGLIVGAVAIAVVVVVVVLSSSKSSAPSTDAATAYRQKVARAFGPLLGANAQLSQALAAVRGTDPADAKLAAVGAQHATTVASGALDALAPPPAAATLARQARMVLDRENAYLAGVSAVLNHPSVAGASQMQTLASNLTSALDAAGPTVAGSTPTVSGADRLTAWARTTSRTLQGRAAAKARANRAKGSHTTTTTVVVGGSNPDANGQSCGGGLFAGPNTSCAFAVNVRREYESSGGSSVVRAFSPTTGRTYTMSCARSGGSVTCVGGNDASVTF